MAEPDMKTLGYRIYDAFNARDIAAAEELFAPNFISHALGTVGGLRTSLTSLFTKYPAIHVVVEDLLVEGDKVALRMAIQGVEEIHAQLGFESLLNDRLLHECELLVGNPAIATLGIAWSGYQGARWNGRQAEEYSSANGTRAHANHDATTGDQARTQDLLNFNRWLEVATEGNQQLADLYERRFRPEFRPAFEAWGGG